MMFNIDDDVTINGKVISTDLEGRVQVRLKSGKKIIIESEDINTVRPHINVSKDDLRKGK